MATLPERVLCHGTFARPRNGSVIGITDAEGRCRLGLGCGRDIDAPQLQRPPGGPARKSVNVFAWWRHQPRETQVAQLVEHVCENHGVGGSIPSLGAKNYFRPSRACRPYGARTRSLGATAWMVTASERNGRKRRVAGSPKRYQRLPHLRGLPAPKRASAFLHAARDNQPAPLATWPAAASIRRVH
jgi:hypothetical protein